MQSSAAEEQLTAGAIPEYWLSFGTAEYAATCSRPVEARDLRNGAPTIHLICMDFLMTFFGRFHPLLVHLPIGILFLAFFFECLSFAKRYKRLRRVVQPALFWGAVFAAAAAITGFFLRKEGGYEPVIADRHQNFGIITAVLAFVVYVIRPKVRYWVDSKQDRRKVKLALSVPLILSLLITGHWGGSLTHGEDYLTAVFSMRSGEDRDPAEKIRGIADVSQAVYYADVIQPILESRCYDCHSAAGQKGDLRLDRVEFIMKGGKNGLVIRDGPADSSSLYHRLTLPIEHDDHMPPREKTQLSSSEIALIQYWVEDNASFDKQVHAFASSGKIETIIKAMQEPPQKSWIPEEKVDAISASTLGALRAAGINTMPLAAGSNYVVVSFAGAGDISDQQVDALGRINDQLVSLDLSHTRVGDGQLALLARLTKLRVLNLNNTPITDSGFAGIKPLQDLRRLSLVNTRVSDESVPTLQQLKNLNSLYLYGTNLSLEAIARLAQGNDELRIDTGNYRLEKLPTDTIVFKRVRTEE